MGMMQDFAHARTERRGEVATLFRGANNILKGFHQAHAATSRELRGDLAKVAPALRGAEAGRMRTETQNITQRRSDVSAMLNEFDKARAAMSKELRAELTTAQAERRRTAAQDSAQRRSDVEAIRVEVWGAVAPARVKVTPPPPRAEAPPVAPPPVEELPKDEAIARAEPVEATPEAVALRDRVFQYLAYHPDGARMTELEEEFGRARIQMATLLRSLIDDSKVEKRDLLYFAI